MEHSIQKKKSFPWEIIELGVIGYATGLQLQQENWDKTKQDGEHRLMLLQHTPVITLGRRTDPSHLLLTETELKTKGIELFKANRGGSATYHGPGQLVGYIICKSSRYGGIHNVVEMVLNAINSTLIEIGIDSIVDYDNPGVWTKTDPPRKLAAVGMSNREGITMHGFALNVDLPLTGFSAIVPCGLQLPVTTIAIETGKRMKIVEVKNLILKQLDNLFHLYIA